MKAEIKITIDQLKNYLGTDLQVVHPWTDRTTWTLHHDSDRFGRCSINAALLMQARPVCYRLSDLDKEIEHNGERFVPEKELKKITKFSLGDKAGLIQFNGLVTSFLVMQKLFEWHFWPFGEEYFEKGLVIDKMKHQNDRT